MIDEQDEDEFTSTAYYYLARAFSAKKAISLINKYCALAKKCYEKVGFKERTLTENAFRFKDESWGRCNMVIKR